MDTNEKTAVKIVRDCLTTAHESLPEYASCLYVASMPIIKAHGVDDATTRHMIVAAFRVAALRSRSVDYRSGFMPDVRVTRVHAFKRHAAVYCETNTGYHYKVECTPLCDTVSDWLTPCLMGQVDTFEWTDQGWNMVMRDYANLV
jgi:hypothetical protein